LTTFIIPDNAVIDDEAITTKAGTIIGNHAVIERHLHVGFLMAGASVHVTGRIVSNDDIRADVWCKFDSDVTGGGDAYLGEFTTINGKITVEGDLDIGKEVKLNGGFLSKGWIVVRNPLPIMVFIFLYIRELMRLGRTSEEIDKTIGELFEGDEEIDLEKLDEADLSEILNRGGFFVIPIGSKITPESISVPEDTVVGKNCVINTRIICKRFEGGKDLTLCGVLRSKGETFIDDGSRISGEIITAGKLVIGKDVKIEGTVSAKSVIIHETSFVEGKVSSGNVRFAKGDGFEVKDHENPEKAELLSKADSFDLIKTNIIERKKSEAEDEEETETYLENETEKQPVEESVSTTVSEGGAAEISEDEATAVSEDGTTEISEKGAATVSKDEAITVSKDGTAAETESVPAQKEKVSARAKRRNSRKAKQSQVNKLEIVNVFTGENIETAEPEQEKISENEAPDSKSEKAVQKEEEPVPKDEEDIQKDEEPIPKDEEDVQKDEESVPKDEEPVPKNEEPAPKDEKPVPKGKKKAAGKKGSE